MFRGKPGLRILVMTMAMVAFMSVSLVSAEGTYTFNSKSSGNAALRSLMLPGWGQFFNEQPTKGFIFAGAELIAIGTAFMMYSGANSTYSDYETKRTTALYDDYSSKIDTANMFVYLAAAIWAGNVLDAYLSADSGASTPHKKSKKSSKIKKPSKKKKVEVEEEFEEGDPSEEQIQEEAPTPPAKAHVIEPTAPLVIKGVEVLASSLDFGSVRIVRVWVEGMAKEKLEALIKEGKLQARVYNATKGEWRGEGTLPFWKLELDSRRDNSLTIAFEPEEHTTYTKIKIIASGVPIERDLDRPIVEGEHPWRHVTPPAPVEAPAPDAVAEAQRQARFEEFMGLIAERIASQTTLEDVDKEEKDILALIEQN